MLDPRNDVDPVGRRIGVPDLGDVEQRLAAGGPERVGAFRYFFDEDRWEWTAQVARIHGYAPGTVTPTTQLVLRHKHPGDYRHVADTLALIRQTRQPFSSRHRICDAQGHIRHVVVVAEHLCDDAGTVTGAYGFYIDITPQERVRQDQLTAALTTISENRAVIEQAKGMLMLVYGIDAAAAFELLRQRSQDKNVKLRSLAQQVVADFNAAPSGGTLASRSIYHGLLLTAHRRIAHNGAQTADPDKPS